MAREPQSWYCKDRDAWFATIACVRHNHGLNKKKAQDSSCKLMQQPKKARVSVKAFAVVADNFLKWLTNNRSPATYEWYRYRIERFCLRWPDLVAADIRPLHVQQWVDSYSVLSQTSRRNYVRSVKRCVKWATQQGYLPTDPVASMEVPGAESKDVCISPAEFEELCSYIRDETFLDLVRVAFESGCRPQEILRVEARHFDAKNGRWVLPPKEAKGKKKPRIVYLSAFGQQVTEKLCKLFPEGKLFRNTKGKARTTDAVNCGFLRLQIRIGKDQIKKQGLELDTLVQEHLNQEGEGRQFKGLSVAERIKFRNCIASTYAPKYSLYALRHSWSTRALQSGLDALTVAVLMGHNDPSTRSRVYQHIAHSPEHMRKQAARALQG